MNDRKTTETIATYHRWARSYQERFMDFDLYNDSFDRFCRLIEKSNPLLFEIGVGPGNITRYILSRRPDFDLYGIDLAPAMVELAQQNNPQARFEVMDCRNIGHIDQQFDAVMCGFCLPYLSKTECDGLISDVSKCLTSGGLFYVSTMEGEYHRSGFETTSFSNNDRVHIYYHQAAFLSECFDKAGFEILDLERKQYPESDGTFLTDMIFIVRKRESCLPSTPIIRQ